MDIKDIQNLIKFISKTDLSEVSLKTDEIEIKVKTGKGQQPTLVQAAPAVTAPAPSSLPAAAPSEAQSGTAPAVEDNSKYVTVKSPMIGTFYQKPSPDKPNFVKVGDSVKEGQTLCIIEAMKLFNEIESEISGKIVKILVEDSSPVEFDQPLFLIDPS